MYYEAKRGLADIHWQCDNCLNHCQSAEISQQNDEEGGSDDDEIQNSFSQLSLNGPVANSTELNAEMVNDVNRSISFSFGDIPYVTPQPVIEDNIVSDNDEINDDDERLPEAERQYEIVTGGTKRGNLKLVDNIGYSYVIKRRYVRYNSVIVYVSIS